MSEQVQGAVTAAIRWFVIEATELASSHCVGIANPPVPDVMVWADHQLTVQEALRPAALRPYAARLRHVVELCEPAARQALGSLPKDERVRVRGGPDSSPTAVNREVLGPLLDDFVYARAWLTTYGTKDGYWAYRWVSLCLDVAAFQSDSTRVNLAAALIDSADHCFDDALTHDNP